jgi:predicted DNA-binding transcriptional regulator AlpA
MRVDVDNLIDTAGIAERVGVQPSTIHQWRQRALTFPNPVRVFKIGPVWNWPEVERWLQRTGRIK